MKTMDVIDPKDHQSHLNLLLTSSVGNAKRMSKINPLIFDPANAFVAPHGITQAQFDGLKDKLIACRAEVLAEVLVEDAQLDADGTKIPDEKQPLDAQFLEMPERMLDAYQSDRENSELGRCLLYTSPSPRDGLLSRMPSSA